MCYILDRVPITQLLFFHDFGFADLTKHIAVFKDCDFNFEYVVRTRRFYCKYHAVTLM